MQSSEQFLNAIKSGYTFKGECVKIGVGMLDGNVVEGADVLLPFRTMNRHGLIAGATGTGKTKTLQVMSEVLSEAGIPVLLLDIKGDLSGLAAPADINDKLIERSRLLNFSFTPTAFPVELFSLSNEKGARLRSTVTEFGPVLLGKILGLNDTQGGLLSIIFKYCDDHKLPLIDLKDFTKILQYLSEDGKADIEKEYGKISTASTGTILRKVVELQQQGADSFFSEPSFEVDDLMQQTQEGKGVIHILRVTDMQNRPKLFSTFMLQLLAEIYATAPEVGDREKPRLIMFIDEAHLLFQEASSVLLQQIEMVIKLIRSKGIGIFFCTQNPQDIPADILSQLGLKIQHALRAFTAADRKTIKKAAENFPESEFYETDKILTQMGIGEALITLLNEKGIPTPLVHTILRPPQSRMNILTEEEIDNVIKSSRLVTKYNREIDSESAYEILNGKLDEAEEKSKSIRDESSANKSGRTKEEKGFFDNPAVRQAGRTAASILTRSLLGALGLGGRTTRRRKKSNSFW